MNENAAQTGFLDLLTSHSTFGVQAIIDRTASQQLPLFTQSTYMHTFTSCCYQPQLMKEQYSD
jgi:hypothetical protein